jgi:hypothetical protein
MDHYIINTDKLDAYYTLVAPGQGYTGLMIRYTRPVGRSGREAGKKKNDLRKCGPNIGPGDNGDGLEKFQLGSSEFRPS